MGHLLPQSFLPETLHLVCHAMLQYNGVYQVLTGYYSTMDGLAQVLIADFTKVGAPLLLLAACFCTKGSTAFCCSVK
jgi:hypothetical protein